MNVVSMAGNSDARACATLLSQLFKRAVGGDLDGVVVTFHSPTSGEETEMAGTYARDKAAALKACLRQSVALGLYEAGRTTRKPAAQPIPLRPRRTR